MIDEIADHPVAWLRYHWLENGNTVLHLCDSDAPGAFKVYTLASLFECEAVVQEACAQVSERAAYECHETKTDGERLALYAATLNAQKIAATIRAMTGACSGSQPLQPQPK